MDSEQMSFAAYDEAELYKRIRRLETRVPIRKERTTNQCEQWLIHVFLECLRKENCLHAPVRLKKRERPDFELTLARQTTEKHLLLFGSTRKEALRIGVECSEVINQNEAKRLAYEEEQDRGTPIKVYSEDGYAGDSPEVEFAESIFRAVETKHKKLVNGFDRFEKDLLLLYYNNFRPSLRKNAAVSRTREELCGYWARHGFDVVIVYVAMTMMVFMHNYSGIFNSGKP